MGVLPLEFMSRDTAASVGLTGKETFDITGIEKGLEPGKIGLEAQIETAEGLTNVDTIARATGRLRAVYRSSGRRTRFSIRIPKRPSR